MYILTTIYRYNNYNLKNTIARNNAPERACIEMLISLLSGVVIRSRRDMCITRAGGPRARSLVTRCYNYSNLFTRTLSVRDAGVILHMSMDVLS